MDGKRMAAAVAAWLLRAVCALLPAVPAAAGVSFAAPLIESVDRRDELPSRSVTALAHGADGLLWVGTQRGLLRYDGYRFQAFAASPDHQAAPRGAFVQSLLVDSVGAMWVGTASDGLDRYDPRSERFVPVAVPDGSGTIWAIVEDIPRRVVYAATERGVVAIAADGSVEHVPGLPEGRALALAIAEDGSLWVGGLAGLRRRLPSGAVEAISLRGSTEAPSVTALLGVADGSLWIGTRGAGVYRWTHGQDASPVDPKPHSGRLARSWVRALARGHGDGVWVGTVESGLFEIASSGAAVRQHLRADPAVPGSLALDNIGALLPHPSGLLWIGTWGGGLQRLNLHNRAFRHLRAGSNGNGLSHPDVRAVLELSDGRWLIGTAGNGIDVWLPERGRVGGLRAGDGSAAGLADASVISLAEDVDLGVWIGTRTAGLYRADPSLRTLRRYAREQGLPSDKVNRLLRLPQGGVLAATDAGLAEVDAQGQVRRLAVQGAERLDGPVGALAQTPDGKVWAAARDGLWMLDLATGAARRIAAEPARADGLPHDKVNGLLVDRQGQLWVDTAGGLVRLLHIDAQGQAHFDPVGARAGIAGVYAGGNLLEDRSGVIWTQWFRIDPRVPEALRLSRADGIDIGTAWAGSATALRDGRLVFGGTSGLLIVDPEQFRAWDYTPPLWLGGLRVDGLPQPAGALQPRLELASDTRHFALEVAALDFSAPDSLRYAYRLVGLDEDWIDIDASRRQIGYGNLWPGDYVLEVRGSNRLGVYAEQPLRQAIRVAPALWQRPSFASALALLLVAAGWLLLRWRVGRIAARNRALQALVDQRTRDLREHADRLAAQNEELDAYAHSVAHDLKNPLSALLGAARLIEHGQLPRAALVQASGVVARNVRTMSSIIDALLLLGSVRTQSELATEALDMGALVADVLPRLDGLIRAREASLHLEFGNARALAFRPWLEQVWVNLISNALKYGGEAPRIELLYLGDDAGQVSFACRDHGPGVPESQRGRLFKAYSRLQGDAAVEGHGLGLSLARRMLQRMGGDLHYEDTPGGGATFRFRLPSALPNPG